MRNFNLEAYNTLTAKVAQGLPNGTNARNIGGTTTQNGHRNRHSSGLFLSQIPTLEPLTQAQTEFAIRSIRRNKADGLAERTNNASLFCEVVEAVSHPITGGTFPKSNTKTQKTMKTQSSPVCTMGAYPHNAFSPFAMGVANA